MEGLKQHQWDQLSSQDQAKGGFMGLSELAGASDEETDKTRNGWMRGVDGSVRER